MMRQAIGAAFGLALCMGGLPALAVAASPAPAAAPQAPMQQADAAAPRRFESLHKGRFNGKALSYKALVEEHFITGPDGKRRASVFTTSYIATGSGLAADRPVLFVFNGGPGSSSLWLHMGFVGPKRIDFGDVLKPRTVPPFRLIDNPQSPLDVADIVLIDPPGTGFSTILPGGQPEQFYGVTQDAAAVLDVMQQWVRGHNRWNAPKYLLSESYGTVRAAAVAKLMAGGPLATGHMDGMTLNGVILLGQSMNMERNEELAFALDLPTLAATACHFGKVARPCTAAGQAAAARAFIDESYARALIKGDALGEAERGALADRIAALTGLSRDYVLASNLRVGARDFSRQLLAAEGKQTGLYDGRYTLPLSPSGGDPVADDPAMGQYVPAYVATLNDYMRNDLGVRIDSGYEAISFRQVNGRWDYGFGPGVPVGRNFAEDLAIAMRRNPHLRTMIGIGYYDLVTTLGAAEYMATHSGLPAAAIEKRYYESGHMPYMGEGALAQLAQDVRRFVTADGRP